MNCHWDTEGRGGAVAVDTAEGSGEEMDEAAEHGWWSGHGG